ncbi:hypothetical protein JCM6882_007074 [Rhodosporidiobolus microsporus]
MSVRTEAPAELSNPGPVLLWGNSPNGWKCTYLLQGLKEEGSIPDYTAIDVDLQRGEQFQPWFRDLNPNSKMPVLVDNRPGKKPITVFESASILLYLARAYDQKFSFSFEDDNLHSEMMSWIIWAQSGQMNFFFRYSAGPRNTQAIERFTTETSRLYQVLDDHLSGKHTGRKRDYIVEDKFSLADMVAEPWIRCAFWGGLSLDDYPALQAWIDRIEALPFIQAALKVPIQDLVTRIKSNPDLERQIMENMRKLKEEQAAKEKEEKEEKERQEKAAEAAQE